MLTPISKSHLLFCQRILSGLSTLLLLSACQGQIPGGGNQGMEIKFLAGSDLKDFCEQAAEKLNNTRPTLDDGQQFYLTCEATGSGDVVTNILGLAQQLKSGAIAADAPEFPTLLAVDGEIYQSQLIYQMDKIAPGENYIPALTDSPLIAFSPMVFMTTAELAPGLQKVDDLYTKLVTTDNHSQLDPNAPALSINYVHTAPTRSNSGLQTLVAQFASLANKPPEQLTLADVQAQQDKVRQIQTKITRYGTSSGSLAQSMVQNGPFWASVGSVYESLVIAANSQANANQTKYQAVYPQKTFTSNIRAMLPNAPWVSDAERQAAEQVIEFMRLPETQEIAVNLGLRPSVPGVALGAKFSPEFGVINQPNYESYRPPQPEVVEAMLKSWEEFAKKPSLVVVVVDTSGSMEGQKLTAVQNTLYNYLQNLGPKEQIALIRFSSDLSEPLFIQGDQAGLNQGTEWINSLRARGATRLFDSALYARNWLRGNLRPDAINAVLLLTDGVDSGSDISLDQLSQELEKSGFGSDERIAFFTVGYGKEGEFDASALENIAQINGGYFRPGDPETIAKLMADLQLEF